jgi:hypothetical protein
MTDPSQAAVFADAHDAPDGEADDHPRADQPRPDPLDVPDQWHAYLDSLPDAGASISGANAPKLSVASVFLLLVDWKSTFKETHASTASVWDMLRLLCPPDTDMGTYRAVRKILKSHSLESVCRYDACPRGCVVYKDFSGSQAGCQYKDLDECPRSGCGHPRYVGVGAKRTACHYVYHFSVASWVRALFSQPDLVEHLRNDTPLTRPPTSVLRSFGYRDKVYNNAKLNGDSRNQGLVLSSDGVPYFGSDGANGTRGCWPVVLRTANLPDGLSKSFDLSHMVALEAQEHMTVDALGRVKMERRYTLLCHRFMCVCIICMRV